MNSTQEIQVNIGEIAISNRKCEKLLGNHFDNKLTFEPHVRSSAKRTARNSAFAKIANFLRFEQRKKNFNAFMTSQFYYAPVVCMFHNRKLNNHINHIYETALRIAYQDNNSMFNELRAKDGSFRIHDHNLQKLLIEICKVKMKLAPKIMNEIFDIIECQYPELRFKSIEI